MIVLIKVLACLILLVPVFFLFKFSLSFLSKRIEKELTENGEEFSVPQNPKRVYFVFYIITAVLFVLSAVVSGDAVDAQSIVRLISTLALSAVLSIVSVLDITYYVIPNGLVLIILVYSAIVSFLLPLAFNTEAFGNMLQCAIGFLAGGLSLLIINLLTRLLIKRDGIGGGDIKLMFAVGLLLGWKLTVFALLFGFIIGAICSLVLRLISNSDGEKSLEIPFGPYLSLGSIVAVLFGEGLINWYVGLLGFN